MDRESLLDTIRRLLALGSSPNEHESKLAMAKAAELMAQHNLDQRTVEVATDGWEDKEVFVNGNGVPFEVGTICHILDDHFFVFTYTKGMTYCRKRKVQVFGKPENVAVGEYVFAVLLRTFRQLARKQFFIDSVARKNYFLGLDAGFREQFEKTHAKSDADRAMIVKGQAMMKSAMEARSGMELGKSRTSRIEQDAGAFQRGQRDGREIKVHTPIGQQSKPLAITN